MFAEFVNLIDHISKDPEFQSKVEQLLRHAKQFNVTLVKETTL